MDQSNCVYSFNINLLTYSMCQLNNPIYSLTVKCSFLLAKQNHENLNR
jgi:hypothetical protein